MKNVALIEARYNSTRLKGKILLNLNKRYKTIDFVIQNLLASNSFNKKNIKILTSKNKSDNKITNYLKTKYDLEIFKGPEENVYMRIYNFVKRRNIKNILRVTSDNPLVDPDIIDNLVNKFEKKRVDYMSLRTMEHSTNWNEKSDFPEGVSLEIFKKKIFLKFKNLINRKNQSYPTWYFYSQKNNIKREKLKYFNIYKKINKKMRVTLDTKKDYIFLKKIIKFFNLQPGKNNLKKIIKNQSIKKISLININKKKKIAHRIINS